MRVRPFVVACVVSGAAAGFAACGGDDDGDQGAGPVLDEIGAAIGAVETERDGPQEYFEINANRQLVNLFVAVPDESTDDPDDLSAIAYTYVGGALAPPKDPEAAEGETFVGEAVDFDAGSILATVHDELPDGDVTLFSIVGGPDGAVQYSAYVETKGGAPLVAIVGPDGRVLDAGPAT